MIFEEFMALWRCIRTFVVSLGGAFLGVTLVLLHIPPPMHRSEAFLRF